ncbi:MAG: response regulator [Candidatus Omnitrophica bacterium]|nr:response regulator [Candidatus Omnitrophota bacterium]
MENNGKILLVDDDEQLVGLMRQNLELEGYEIICAYDGDEALEKAEQVQPDIILLDVTMPKKTGFEVCRILKERPQTRFTPIVLVTALGRREEKIKGIESGADDFLSKPVSQEELLARIKSLIKVKKMHEELEEIENILYTLINIIDAKDAYTRSHCERVTSLAVLLAQELKLSNEQISLIEKAAKLHDIGKIGIPESILNKPGALTVEEFNVIKQHSVFGEKICEPLRSLRPVLKIIRHHHEHFDGTGYPDGLSGEKIPLEARVIAIADGYDAMATNRPYRNALLQAEIVDILHEGSGSQWDPDITKAFLKMIGENIFE